MTVVKLNKPVNAYGDPITEVTIRAPTGKDIRKTGLPHTAVKQDDGTIVNRVDMEAMAKLIVLLGNIPMSSVDEMSYADLMLCAGAVSAFLEDSPETSTSSTDTTT
jgi:hypothetical protein